MPRKLTKDDLRRLSRKNSDTVRQQRADLSVWDELLDLSCRYDITPIDLLATVYTDCKEQIVDRLDLLYGYKKGETIKLN